MPGPAARSTAGFVSPVSQRRPTGRLWSRPQGERPGLRPAGPDEEQYRVWLPFGELGGAGRRNVSARHPQALLGRRGINHRRQQRAIHVCMAQQRDRPRRGAIAENPAAGGSFGHHPVMEGRSVSMHIALKPSEGSWVADTDASVVRQERPDDVVRAAAPVGVPGRGQQDGASVEVEKPGGARAEADRRQHGGQRGRRVIRQVPVPERVPLPVTDDRAQRVILKQKHASSAITDVSPVTDRLESWGDLVYVAIASVPSVRRGTYPYVRRSRDVPAM